MVINLVVVVVVVVVAVAAAAAAAAVVVLSYEWTRPSFPAPKTAGKYACPWLQTAPIAEFHDVFDTDW